jgi:glycosyltransferase involved in cell wall biosynthesis
MHIGLIAQGGAGWAGGSEYVRNLARAIRATGEQVRISLFGGEPQRAEWEKHAALFDSMSFVPVRKKRGWLDRFRASNRDFTNAVARSGVEFLYPFTYDNEYNVGMSLPIGDLPCRWAAWIPDFQHRHLPHLFTEKEIGKRNRGIEAVVSEAKMAVLSSESAAVDFRSFYPAHASKTAVLRFATFPDANWYEPFEAENLDWLPRRYFVVCNQFWSHKNHATVFRALEILAARGIRPMIVCTGALVDFRQPEHTERLLQQMHRAGVGAQVMLLGLVPRRLQIEVIRRSLAVVQPSLFEGWSTVVEDARVLGKPTLLSDLAVHKEQNPPGAEFFPGSDADTLATLLADAWANFAPGPNLRAEAQARETAKARIVEVGFDCLRIAKS